MNPLYDEIDRLKEREKMLVKSLDETLALAIAWAGYYSYTYCINVGSNKKDIKFHPKHQKIIKRAQKLLGENK